MLLNGQGKGQENGDQLDPRVGWDNEVIYSPADVSSFGEKVNVQRLLDSQRPTTVITLEINPTVENAGRAFQVEVVSCA